MLRGTRWWGEGWRLSLPPLAAPSFCLAARSPDSPWPCLPRAFQTRSSICQNTFPQSIPPASPHTKEDENLANCSESFRPQCKAVSLQGEGWKRASERPSLPSSPPTQVRCSHLIPFSVGLWGHPARRTHSQHSAVGLQGLGPSVAVALAVVCVRSLFPVPPKNLCRRRLPDTLLPGTEHQGLGRCPEPRDPALSSSVG